MGKVYRVYGKGDMPSTCQTCLSDSACTNWKLGGNKEMLAVCRGGIGCQYLTWLNLRNRLYGKHSLVLLQWCSEQATFPPCGQHLLSDVEHRSCRREEQLKSQYHKRHKERCIGTLTIQKTLHHSEVGKLDTEVVGKKVLFSWYSACGIANAGK